MGSYKHRSDVMNFRLVKIVLEDAEETNINLPYIPTFERLERNFTSLAEQSTVGIEQSYSQRAPI